MSGGEQKRHQGKSSGGTNPLSHSYVSDRTRLFGRRTRNQRPGRTISREAESATGHVGVPCADEHSRNLGKLGVQFI